MTLAEPNRPQRSRTFWDVINLACRTYLDALKMKVGTYARMTKIEEQEMLYQGLMIKEIYIDDETEKEHFRFVYIKPEEYMKRFAEDNWDTIPYTDEAAFKKLTEWATLIIEMLQPRVIAKMLGKADDDKTNNHDYIQQNLLSKELFPNSKELLARDKTRDLYAKARFEQAKQEVLDKVHANPEFQMFANHAKLEEQAQKQLLKEAGELIHDQAFYNYCQRVKGAGEVGAFTCLGYINPKISLSAGKMWRFLGLYPGAKMEKGKKGDFNQEVKGRFWVIADCLIKAGDPYYYGMYKLKKEYYLQMPHLLALKEQKPKGWKGRIHRMAMRFMLKIFISHALEIIRISEGIGPLDLRRQHRLHLPIKPDPEDLRANGSGANGNGEDYYFYLERFARGCAYQLERAKEKWVHDPTPDKANYKEWLRSVEPTDSIDKYD